MWPHRVPCFRVIRIGSKYTARARCRTRLFGPSFQAARSVSLSPSFNARIRFIPAAPHLNFAFNITRFLLINYLFVIFLTGAHSVYSGILDSMLVMTLVVLKMECVSGSELI